MIFLLPLCYVMFLPDCGTGAGETEKTRPGTGKNSGPKTCRNTLFSVLQKNGVQFFHIESILDSVVG